MTEEIEFILESTEESMEGSIVHLEKEFLNIRAGKASPQMLGSVFVDYYGSQTPLSQVANVNVPDARTITIQPYEKNLFNSNFGFLSFWISPSCQCRYKCYLFKEQATPTLRRHISQR